MENNVSFYWTPFEGTVKHELHYTKHGKLKVNQSCPTLCDLMDCIVHGILQTRILEWVAFPFSRGSSQARDRGSPKHGKISPQMLLSNSSLPWISSPNLFPFPGVFMVSCLSAHFIYAKVSLAFSFLSSHSLPSLSRNSISMGKSFVILHGFFHFSSLPSILVSIAVYLSVKMWIFFSTSE